MSFESQHETFSHFLLVINSKIANMLYISHLLAPIARTDFQSHPKSIIFISSEKAYVTSY